MRSRCGNASVHLPGDWRLRQNLISFAVFRFFRPIHRRIQGPRFLGDGNPPTQSHSTAIEQPTGVHLEPVSNLRGVLRRGILAAAKAARSEHLPASRQVLKAGCKDRANAGRRQKTRRPEGFHGTGCLASLLLSRRSTSDILLRRLSACPAQAGASPDSLFRENRARRNYKKGCYPALF